MRRNLHGTRARVHCSPTPNAKGVLAQQPMSVLLQNVSTGLGPGFTVEQQAASHPGHNYVHAPYLRPPQPMQAAGILQLLTTLLTADCTAARS